MNKIIFVILFFVQGSLLFSFGKIEAGKDQCYICHESVGSAEAVLYKKDIHFQMGISCAACHGGDESSDDMDKAMSKDAGYKGVPKGNAITEACIKCHASSEMMKKFGVKIPTNQFELLKNSVHGKLSLDGSQRIVQCITCHNAHGIVEVTNPASPVYPTNVPETCGKCHSNPAYMRSYDPSLPVDQLSKYRTSVHGIRNAKGDPKPAQCESCHGSHGILSVKDPKSSVYPTNVPATCSHCHSNVEYMKQYKIPTDQYENYSKSVHGIALLQKHDIGAPACNSCHGNHAATPPGVKSISKVCGTCHALNADLFSSSPHKKAFDKLNLPECETCHSNHYIITATDKLLGVSPDAVCSRCHQQNKSPKGYYVAKEMKQMIDSLESSEKNSMNLIQEAEQKGMEVAEAEFKLRDANQARLEAKTMVHSFDEAKFNEVIDKGLKVTSSVKVEAADAIHEFYFRRIGLGVSLVIISFLALILYFYIRRIERK